MFLEKAAGKYAPCRFPSVLEFIESEMKECV
jgi:hypothetical protein